MLVKNSANSKSVYLKFRGLTIMAPFLFFIYSFASPVLLPNKEPMKNSNAKDSLVTTSTTEAAAAFSHLEALKNQLGHISDRALTLALNGYQHYVDKGIIAPNSLLAIADMSAPSDQERFYIINPNQGLMLYHTLVAHGRNSGDRYATHFSNKISSLQSSMGFFKTGDSYQGKHGSSLRLIGLEKGLNDKALERGIVIHGADYVSSEMAQSRGMIGRSWGCPAVPSTISNQIIESMQDNQCLFIYHPSYQNKNF